MSTTAPAITQQTGFTREGVVEFSQLRNEPQWLRDWRLAAFATYESLPFPQRTDEEWRRTDLRALKLDKFAPYAGVGETVDSLTGILPADSAGTSQAGIIVQRDAATIYTHVEQLPEGVIFTDLTTAVREHPELVQQYLMTQVVPVNFGKFEALHAAFWQGGSFLYVPKGQSVELPLRSFAIAHTAGASLFNHTLIVVEDNAEAFLVDAYQSETKEGATFASSVVELILGRGAKLRYVQLQDYGRNVWNMMTERAILGRDATLNSLQVTLGSKWSKNSIGSHLRGENSLAEMLGIFFGDSDQFFDHHTWQLHESPYATSDLEFKGALRDSARSVYSGLIKVSEGAQKTDAYQQNRNLLLSREARADSIPNLEIGANDVRCTHGATISQVVPEHVFYLQARGIPRTEAQKLIVEGFFRPVIDRIPDEGIQNFLEGAIARKVGL
ncbi:MAG TPA: Fe-S cluster assembly protein SufD [Thermomicrobiales bacterium]|nr:Fe-S cluster assembly protein SufD [Thermomicrobiales bacterium]HRA48382.1 Fe-S cluster assembly protein SufD [Thermomicrobiales bacterium]